MARIKIVPLKEMNADGDWIDIPVDFPRGMKWREMERLLTPHIPAGFFVVAAERAPNERSVQTLWDKIEAKG